MWQLFSKSSVRESDEIRQRYQLARQEEQTAIALVLREVFQDRRILEVGCGAGFWTEMVADVAKYILAIDKSPEMLTVALEKPLSPQQVEFRVGDLETLSAKTETFDGALVNFCFSHLPKAETAQFLRKLHDKLEPGAAVFMVDNLYNPQMGEQLFNQPGKRDTFKIRQFSESAKHQVVRNYYDAAKLQNLLGLRTTNLEIQEGKCFWWLSYRLI
ncbi:MAG: class I SAM-dependent methyltransferase [Cyanosarcina radialis HA8281-LM2]|jgi:ubiquinone/menaquinone biosynthesis C-methylase UbiE|nr:class I SAM-dependent methyltransferase [Cyanosarcina radialis HA8281-LM2]